MDFEKLRCNCGTCGSDAPAEEKKEGETTEAPAEGEEKKEE